MINITINSILIRKLIFDLSNVAIYLIVPVNNQLKLLMLFHTLFPKFIGISVIFYSKVNLQI